MSRSHRSHRSSRRHRPFARALTVVAGVLAGAVLSFAPGALPAAAAPTFANPFPYTARLDSTPVSDVQLSADGLWVVYRTSSNQIRSIPTGQGSIRQIAIGQSTYQISPDSSRIVYGDSTHLYSVPIAGGAPVTPLFQTADMFLAWGFSGDGRHVWALEKGPAGGMYSHLYSTSIDGGTPIRLDPDMPAGRGVEHVQPSPDGRSLAYNADPTGVLQPFVVPIDGGTPVALAATLPVGPQYWVDDWSPDSRFVIVEQIIANQPSEIFSWDSTDGTVRPMTAGPAGHTITQHRMNDDSVVAVVKSGGASLMRRVRFDGHGSATLSATSGNLSILGVFATNVVYTDSSTSTLYQQPLDGSMAITMENVNALTSSSVSESFEEHRVFWTDGDTKVHTAPVPMSGPVGGTVISGNLAYAAQAVTTGDRPIPVVEDGSLKVSDPTQTNATINLTPNQPWSHVIQARGTADGRRVVYLQDYDVDEQYELYVAVPPISTGNTAKYVPLAPFRALDTRVDGPRLNYTGAKPIAGQVVQLKITGLPGIPNSSDVKAAVLNVTATNTDGPGYVTVYPDGQTRPLASSLNLTAANQTRPNLVSVQVPPSGYVDLFTYGGTDLVVDVQGYYSFAVNATDGRFFPLPPSRLLDTRADGPQIGYTGAKPAAGSSFDLQVRGRGGVPVTGVSAVVLNVAATDAAAAGFITVWPTGQPRPLAANLNLMQAGQTISNQVIVPVGTDGKVSFFTQNGTHLVADVAGWFTNGNEGTGSSGLFVPTAPVRMLDTRADGPQVGYTGAKPAAGAVVPVRWLGITSGVTAIVMNVTMTEPTLAGFVTAYPDDSPLPLAANLNVAAGDTIGNHVTAKVGQPEEFVQLYTQHGGQLIADVVGHYTS